MTKVTTQTAVTAAISAKPNAEYEKLVGKADKLIFAFNSQGLRFYWELGHIVHDLCESAPKYGNRTVETFCEDLKKANGNFSFEKSSLYNAKKFYSLISEELLQKAIDGRVTWRGVIDLISDTVTDGQRQSLIQGVASGKYTLGDLATQLDKIKNRVEKKDDKPEKTGEKESSGLGATTMDEGDDDGQNDVSSAEGGEEATSNSGKAPLTSTGKLELTHAGKVKGCTELLAATADKIEGFGKSIVIMLEETTKQKKIDDIVEAVNLAEDTYNMLKNRWEAELAVASKAVEKATGKKR